MYSPFSIGSVGNIATGSINPQNSNLQSVTGIYAALGFTAGPPNGEGSIGLVLWFFSQSSGRAIVELVVLIAAFVEIYFYWLTGNKRSSIKTDQTMKMQINEIHDKVTNGSDEQ